MKLISPNFIGVYDNALSSYKCMEIIKFIESQKLVKGLFGRNKIDLEKKDDWEVDADLCNISNGFFVSQYISSCLSEYTPQYRHRYPEIDSQSSFSVDDNYKLQKYDPGGGYFIPHCENDGSTDLRRMLVWMIYLNTVNDGGGTYFTSYDKTTKAKEGRLIIWPAYWTHRHHGIVSKSQIKYIATGLYKYV